MVNDKLISWTGKVTERTETWHLAIDAMFPPNSFHGRLYVCLSIIRPCFWFPWPRKSLWRLTIRSCESPLFFLSSLLSLSLSYSESYRTLIAPRSFQTRSNRVTLATCHDTFARWRTCILSKYVRSQNKSQLYEKHAKYNARGSARMSGT